jgi:DNA-binding NarL/FixJ family response regulator
MSVRIVLVDDHPLVRDGLKSRLQSRPDWEVVGEADSAEEAVEIIRERHPDVVIVDLSLKRGSGLDLIKHICSFQSPPKILVCSMHDEALYAQRVLQAGAMGFVHKQHASEQIVTAVSRILAGRLHVSDVVAEQLMAHVTRRPSSGDPAAMSRLTDRELEVVEAIGRGATPHQIANDLHLSVKTVETYRERAKKKLGLRTSADLLRFAVLHWNNRD